MIADLSQSESHDEVNRAFFCPKTAPNGLFCCYLGRLIPFLTVVKYELERPVFYS
jgi:hypothetical protein